MGRGGEETFFRPSASRQRSDGVLTRSSISRSKEVRRRHHTVGAAAKRGDLIVVDTVVTKLSFDSGASAWDRFSTRFSALYVPALLAAADIKEGQRVLDVATGTGPSAVEAAVVVGQSGLMLATDLSLPMLQIVVTKVVCLCVSVVVCGC